MVIRRTRVLVAVLVVAIASLACTPRPDAPGSAAEAPPEQRLPTIDHVAPPRDSVGPPPTRFEWTPAKDADEYAIGIWDDVDRLMWRHDHVTGTSVQLPDEVDLGFGTYFWSVTALRGGRPVAESGRSAFVVR